MKAIICTKLILILYSLCFSACTYSENQSVPLNVLGKSISSLQSSNISKLEEIKYPVDEDADAKKAAWKLRISNGHSVIVMDDHKDGSIDGIVVNDAYFETDKKVRVGDRLDKVMAAYADAEFRGDFNSPELIAVYANGGKLKFTFDTSGVDLEKAILQGGLSVENEDIAKVPVWKIQIKQQ